MTWEYSVQLRVSDLDYNGHITAAAYLVYFEESRAQWLAEAWQRADPPYVVVRQELDYLSEARLEDSPLTVIANVIDVRRSSFDITEELVTRTGDRITKSSGTLLAFDLETRRSRPLTDLERAGLGWHDGR